MNDLISRQAAIDAFLTELTKRERKNLLHTWSTVEVKYFVVDMLEKSPSVQPEQTDCEYCHEDSDGYVCPIEKNSHAWLVRRGKVMKLRVGFKGEYRECDILYCPMCGRRLTDG